MIYLNLNPVTPICFNQRAWVLAIDHKARFVHTIRRDVHVGHSEFVVSSDSRVGHVSVWV